MTVAGEQGADALTRPMAATPRADMYALMRAGYVVARTGHDEGCQQIAKAAQDLGDRYQAALDDADYDRDGMIGWRSVYLTEATPVAQLEQPLTGDQIIGSDVRSLEDRDLGDISDVVIGQDGKVDYVIVQAGGFLGIGENEVPVPWNSLKVTAAPYRDTFVLNVSEQTFSEAPRMQGGNRTQLVRGQEGRDVERFWDQNLPDEG